MPFMDFYDDIRLLAQLDVSRGCSSTNRGRMGIRSYFIPDSDISRCEQESDKIVLMGLETH